MTWVTWADYTITLVVPSQLLEHLEPTHWQSSMRSRKDFDVSAAQPQLTHWCIINTVFSTNPNHSTVKATMQKMISVPVKTSASLTALTTDKQADHCLIVNNSSSLERISNISQDTSDKPGSPDLCYF